MDDQASVSFERAAEYYDATRDVGDEATATAVGIVADRVAGRDPVLEIGVGTGILGLPVAARGVGVLGLDLSTAMLGKLRAKPAGEVSVRLVLGDATRLPFPDGAFGAAYGRHILHLIPAWRTAVAELCRVVGDGVVLIDAGTITPEWEEVWRLIAPVLGPEAERVGFDVARDGEAVLDDAFRDAGATVGPVEEFWYPDRQTMGEVIDEIAARSPSWTWRVPDDRLAEAVALLRAWTIERFGRLDVHLADRFGFRWHVYEVGTG